MEWSNGVMCLIVTSCTESGDGWLSRQCTFTDDIEWLMMSESVPHS